MKKALVFGASGFVGSNLLQELLNNPAYGQVKVVVRKNLGFDHPKLTMLIGDYHSLPSLEDSLGADEVFISLGTTKKSTPDQAAYYQIDHDYAVLAAAVAKEKGAKSVFLVSAIGADAKSNIFYIRTKGETERDIIALNFDHTHIFQPSMILGHRKEHRPLEKVLIAIWPVISPIFIGNLSRYRGTDGKAIARAMNNAAEHQNRQK